MLFTTSHRCVISELRILSGDLIHKVCPLQFRVDTNLIFPVSKQKKLKAIQVLCDDYKFQTSLFLSLSRRIGILFATALWEDKARSRPRIFGSGCYLKSLEPKKPVQ